MTPDEQIFTDKQQSLIDLLSLPPYPSIADAARKRRVPLGTAYRWNRDPAFQAAWTAARRANQAELRESIKDEMLAVLPEMFAIKVELARRGLARRDEVRDSAATWVLEYALGKAPNRTEISGSADAPVRVTHSHEGAFDFDEFRSAFLGVLDGSGAATARGDGSPEPVDPA